MGRNHALIAAIVALAASPPAGADDAKPSVSAPEHVVGDGRAVAPVVVSGDEAARGRNELPVPEVATVTCVGASSLAAVSGLPPALLAPVVTQATSLDCVARLRDVESKFRLAVQPPPPGLYASVSAFELRTTVNALSLDAFVWDGTARVAPTSLRAAASDGRLIAQGQELALELDGKAPRLVAIALVDGDRLGAAFVPVTGVTTLPVETEPGARVQCWIAGRWFGPVKTKRKIADVPIEVPPGVTHGVARSTGRAGYITDAITDLKIPARPRIAAVASSEVHVGEPTTIAVAIAGKDGRPGAAALAVVAKASRGTLTAAKALGGGLWSLRYTAPLSTGADRVTIRSDGDTAELDLDVRSGGASRIVIVVPAGPYEPGAEIAGTASVLDAAGNPVLDAAVTATVAGAPLVVTQGEPSAFRGRIPERLPEGEIALELSSGRLRERQAITIGSPAVTASVHAVVDRQHAVVELVVGDRFGNLVQDRAFEVEVTGGSLQQLVRDRSAFRATVVADAGARAAHLVVRAGGRILADERVRWGPPAHAFVLGVWGTGSWVDNLGQLASPRGGAGLGLRRGFGSVEVAVLVGAEGLVFRDTVQLSIGGSAEDAMRSVRSVGLHASVRGRIRLSRRMGAAFAAGIVPMRVRVTLEPSSQSADDYVETVFGVRAQLHGDLELGPGRMVLGVSYGRGALSEGAVVGQIEGIAVVGGYEWWFAAFGW